MRRLNYIITVFFLASCSREVAVPVKVDFDVIVVNEDYSVPVVVKVENRTTGADNYKWTIPGTVSTYSGTSRNPGNVVYEKPGTYTIGLYGSNQDGEEDFKEITLTIYDAVTTSFATAFTDNKFPPARVTVTNTSQGASYFRWYFEGGEPEYSEAKNPGEVVFSTPGEHSIILKAGNGFEHFTQQKNISVGSYLEARFSWTLGFEDEDHQAPVSVKLNNNSISATQFTWRVENGVPSESNEENPTVLFDAPGSYIISLEAANGKEVETVSKKFEVYRNTNIRIFRDVVLGINTAHNSNTKGAFFSTTTGETFTREEVDRTNGDLIDLIFFGLSENFDFNQFVSPDEVDLKTNFAVIPNATHTKFINNIGTCECTASMSISEFDALEDDVRFQSMIIEETHAGLQHFDDTLLPRVILFQAEDGRKGAIKIKKFCPQGDESTIIIDIKVQKQPNQ